MALKTRASKENIYASRNEQIEVVRKQMYSTEINHHYAISSMGQQGSTTETDIL